MLDSIHARLMKQTTLTCISQKARKQTRNTLLTSRHIIIDTRDKGNLKSNQISRWLSAFPGATVCIWHVSRGHAFPSGGPLPCSSALLAHLFCFFHSLYLDQQNTDIVITQATTFLHNCFSKLYQILEYHLPPSIQ